LLSGQFSAVCLEIIKNVAITTLSRIEYGTV